MYSLSEREYLTFFGAKTSLTKAERTYLGKVKKQDLINEASKLGLMIDEKLTKDKIYNVIKKYKQELNAEIKKREKQEEQQRKMYEMSDLLDALQDVPSRPVRPVRPSYAYSKIRETDLFGPELPSRRMPPGSKVIRKEQGLTKTQKTQGRKEIVKGVDDLSDLFQQTSINIPQRKSRETQQLYVPPHMRMQNYGLSSSRMYFR